MVFYQVYIWGYYPILNSFKHGIKRVITYIKYVYLSIMYFFLNQNFIFMIKKKPSNWPMKHLTTRLIIQKIKNKTTSRI
jgi:hypothetical protein